MKIMNFHCNLTSLNITDPYKLSLSKSLNKSLNYINNNIFSYENLFKYRIPIGKNIEWLIKCNIANFYTSQRDHKLKHQPIKSTGGVPYTWLDKGRFDGHLAGDEDLVDSENKDEKNNFPFLFRWRMPPK